MSASTATVSSMNILLEGCRKGDRLSQELLYRQFYGFAMSICLRYTRTREEATEVINDGFMKVFMKAELYDSSKPFKNWLARIMVNTALDHYRHHQKHYYHESLDGDAHHVGVREMATSQLSHQELIGLVQTLSPAYRMVFNLYVMDGYTHEEIAEQLNISVGTSKSNLSRAREHLRSALNKQNNE
ncbi:MAG: sigma-70 family RNA polymerase sigma factor [Cytophagaceae bacterium]|nr:sigma-70 family RNA polymerase sigma factor [Cytophagaceae bacterium]